MTGYVDIAKGKIDNATGASIQNIAGSQTDIINRGEIEGYARITAESTLTNHENATISVNEDIQVKDNSTFTNDGIITGRYDDKHNPLINISHSEFNHNGDIYIGYAAINNNVIPPDEATAQDHYKGIVITDKSTAIMSDKSNIFLASTQSNVEVISVEQGASLTSDTQITLGKQSGGAMGEANTALTVSGTGSNASIGGAITLYDIGSTGVKVKEGGDASITSTITLASKNKTAGGDRNFAAWVEGKESRLTLSDGSHIDLQADSAIGVHVRNGGQVTIEQDADITFDEHASNQVGFLISGNKDRSALKIDYQKEESIQLKGTNSVIYWVERGAELNATHFAAGGALTKLLTGEAKEATLIVATGGNTSGEVGRTEVNLDGFELDVSSAGSTGLRVEGGALVTLGTETQLDLSGDNVRLAKIDGNYYDLNGTLGAQSQDQSTLVSEAKLVDEGSNSTMHATNSVGYLVVNNANLEHKGDISFTATGQNNTGIQIGGGTYQNAANMTVKNSGGTVNNSGLVNVNGVAVDIYGKGSRVINSGSVNATGEANNQHAAAFRLSEGAQLTLTGTGQTEATGSAHGVLLEHNANPADNNDTQLLVSGATINVTASGTGNGIENRAAVAGIQLKDTTINVVNGKGVHTGASLAQENSGVINVTGSGAGIYFEAMDPDGHSLGASNQILDTRKSENLQINVNSAAGKGIYIHSNAAIDSGASVNINHANGGAALIVKGETNTVHQYGQLISKSTAPGVAVVLLDESKATDIINYNRIEAANKDQVAVSNGTASVGEDIYFRNAENAVITGKVNLLTGDNTTVDLHANSQGNGFYTAGGDDRFLLTNVAQDNTTIFSEINAGAGQDRLRLDNSHYRLTDSNNIQGIEHIELTNGSSFTLDGLDSHTGTDLKLGDDKNDGSDTNYAVDKTSLLRLLADANFTFDSHLNGTGRVEVDTATSANQFNFSANNANDGFNGTVALTNTQFALHGNNTTALTQAVLEAGEGSITTVKQGDTAEAQAQKIGGLAFNGGTVQFYAATPGKLTADNYIEIKQDGILDISGEGTVKVDIDMVGNVQNMAEKAHLLPILQQDDGNEFLKLVDASSAEVRGDGRNLSLRDGDDKVISNATTIGITQGGSDLPIAIGTYDYALDSGSGTDGLYIAYNLVQVELQGQNEQALILDALDETARAAELKARVTGSGDLRITNNSGRDESKVTLANRDNDYTGATFVDQAATLRMGNNNVLGQAEQHTRLLNLATQATFDMAGYQQTIAALTSQQSSLVDIGAGQLTVKDTASVAGQVDARQNGAFIVQNLLLAAPGQINMDASTLTVLDQLTNDGDINLLNQSSATIDKIINHATINIDNSSATLALGGTSDGTIILSQAASLNLQGGHFLTTGEDSLQGSQSNIHVNNDAVLAVSGANRDLSVTTTIAQAASGVLDHLAGLGHGDIIIDGLLAVGDGEHLVAAGDFINNLTINEQGIARFSHNENTHLTSQLQGNGTVNVANQSRVSLMGDNNRFNGQYTIDQGAVLLTRYDENDPSPDAVFGTGAALDNQGEVILEVASNWSLANEIKGTGQLTKNGEALLSLDADKAIYTGTTQINQAGIKLNNAEKLLASKQVNIAEQAYLEGVGGVAGSVTNAGSLYVGDRGGQTTITHFTIGQDLNNNGAVYIGQPVSVEKANYTVGNSLTVDGNYTGQAKSYLYFNTVLGNDSSATDQLIITGNSYGVTHVKVTNANGLGDKTNAGILLIDVKGSLSQAEFIQDGRIIAGAYDYVLTRGDGNGHNRNSWYLTQPYLRAETGSYIANLMSIGAVYDLRLHDRVGETQYTDLLTGEEKVTSMWLRYKYAGTDFSVGNGALDNKSSWHLTQLGGDIAQWGDETRSDRFHLGLMASQMSNSNKSTSLKYGYQSKGHVSGYSFGLYGTWYANEADKTGLYVDSWLQWSKFKADVRGEQLASDDYDITGMAASIETGYSGHVGDTENYSLWLQPKGQATWIKLKSDDILTDNGSWVKSHTNNLVTRLGIKAYMSSNQASIEKRNQAGQLFIEANWLHNTTPYSVRIDNDMAQIDGYQNIGEIKFGLEGEIRNNTNVWFNVAYQRGSDDYASTGVMLGMKYSF